ACRNAVPQYPETLQRTAAAHELEALSPFEAFPRAEGDRADCAGPRHVGAAARREIEPLDVDQPQSSPTSRFFSKRKARRFIGSHKPNCHRIIFPDNAVRLVFSLLEFGRAELACEIDRRGLGAEVKAEGPHVEQANDRRRQHVLSGMLL